MIYFTSFKKGTQRYNKNKLCKNNDVETNQRQKPSITILSKEPISLQINQNFSGENIYARTLGNCFCKELKLIRRAKEDRTLIAK